MGGVVPGPDAAAQYVASRVSVRLVARRASSMVSRRSASSSARKARTFFLVYARTHPDAAAPPQKRITCFLVDRGPGAIIDAGCVQARTVEIALH